MFLLPAGELLGRGNRDEEGTNGGRVTAWGTERTSVMASLFIPLFAADFVCMNDVGNVLKCC